MSNTAKFEHACFYDADLDSDVQITPREFNEEKHAARIECTTTDCHASLSYVCAHDTDASNFDRGEYFRTNPYGEGHAQHCTLNPDPIVQTSISMLEALGAGKSILLNINFACSPIKDKGKRPANKARKEMPLIGGSFRPDWIKAHKGLYAPYSGYSADKLAQNAGAFKRALEETGDINRGALAVSYLHGLLPWNRFYARDQKSNQTQDINRFTLASIFENLYSDLEKKDGVDVFWRSSPALRTGTKLIESSREASWSRLFTHSQGYGQSDRNATMIAGGRFGIQDVIDVRDQTIRTAMQASEDFSFVATPYIERKNVQDVLEKGKGPLHVYWPIRTKSQLILK